MTLNVLKIEGPLPKVEGVEHPRRYDLRWRFDFAQKRSVYGPWSAPAFRESEKAELVNKEGLIRASIEARDYYTHEMLIIAECPGPDFVIFKWNAARHKTDVVTFTSFASFHNLIGLKLVTRELEVDVFFDGDSIVKQRTEADKQFHYASFGR